ncbi:Tetratricopeptide repeat-containing protein [Desulfacinum hydrothermale DSM 13146]|uniref:Tetratricopeptide repeat-containing protein n=1 Tax=Desulfacinum hydrothermale DSM 13146 TaxID=1121390 RepID=A0A1W1XW81_9BACT|nr:tetratricopeptide repeat protein [Desulfacinum hydrothermale]SMC28094.1 Tetratricopeptide repeat-containing protein [Desulfacinum hydrothermale DSM 13146]
MFVKTNSRRNIGDMKREAKEALENDDLQKYKSLLCMLQETYPADLWAFRKEALLAARERDWNTVLACTRKVCTKNPQDFDMRILMAKALSKQGLHAEAEAQMRWLERQMKPESTGNARYVSFLLTYSGICADRGNLRRAAAFLQEILDICPDHGEAVIHLARCLRKIGETDRALRVLAQHSDYSDPYWLIEQAYCLARKGKPSKAESLLRRAGKLASSHRNRDSLKNRIREVISREFSGTQLPSLA